MQRIIRYELVDLGLDRASCFLGFGAGKFSEAAHGMGATPCEALADCLAQLASEFEIEALETHIRETYPEFRAGARASPIEGEAMHYYIGIRWDTVPNLDGMNLDDLDELVKAGHSLLTRRDRAALRAYAHNKATAMRCRASGNVARALAFEAECDRIYNHLPQGLKW